MLDGSGRAVFIEIDPGALEFAISLIAGTLKSKAGTDVAQINGTDAFLTQGHQNIFASSILGPDLQFVINGIIFIDPVIAIRIVLSQIVKAVSALRTEEFTAVIDGTVLIEIQGQKAAAGTDKGNLIEATVGINIKGIFLLRERGTAGSKIDDQRIDLNGLVAPLDGEIGLGDKFPAEI